MPEACLVDASPYIFRAYFSLPDSITDAAGQPANALRGFADFLLKLVRELAPTHLAVAFDGSLTTSFRNEIYPDYKAQRDLPPPELEAQLDACRRLAGLFGATFIDRRYEADDLLATLCRQLGAEGLRVVIVSSDKDLCQLVGDGVELLDFARGERYGRRQVVRKFGVRPEQIPDLLALAGDPVDNIPGVAGIGRKTAAALLAEFPDLAAIYDDLDRVAGLELRGARSVAARLEAGRERALLSRRLAVLAADAPIDWPGLDGLARRDPGAGAARRVLEELGLAGLAARVEAR